MLLHRQQSNGHPNWHLWSFIVFVEKQRRRCDAERFTFADRIFYCLTLFFIKWWIDWAMLYRHFVDWIWWVLCCDVRKAGRWMNTHHLFMYSMIWGYLRNVCSRVPSGSPTIRWNHAIKYIKMSTGKYHEHEVTVNNINIYKTHRRHSKSFKRWRSYWWIRFIRWTNSAVCPFSWYLFFSRGIVMPTMMGGIFGSNKIRFVLNLMNNKMCCSRWFRFRFLELGAHKAHDLWTISLGQFPILGNRVEY